MVSMTHAALDTEVLSLISALGRVLQQSLHRTHQTITTVAAWTPVVLAPENSFCELPRGKKCIAQSYGLSYSGNLQNAQGS